MGSPITNVKQDRQDRNGWVEDSPGMVPNGSMTCPLRSAFGPEALREAIEGARQEQEART